MAEFDQILGFFRGFMHYVETSGFEIASLPHSNSLRFFHFVGIERITSLKSATTLQRLICHLKETKLYYSEDLTPFFSIESLKIVANENYNPCRTSRWLTFGLMPDCLLCEAHNVVARLPRPLHALCHPNDTNMSKKCGAEHIVENTFDVRHGKN